MFSPAASRAPFASRTASLAAETSPSARVISPLLRAAFPSSRATLASLSRTTFCCESFASVASESFPVASLALIFADPTVPSTSVRRATLAAATSPSAPVLRTVAPPSAASKRLT